MKIEIECTEEKLEELMEIASKRYVSTKTRFDVEDAIDQVAHTLQDMDAFICMYIDSPKVMSEDEVWNYLDGIRNVLKLRVDVLWDAHRQREHIDGYGTLEEVVSNRMAKATPVIKPKKKVSKQK